MMMINDVYSNDLHTITDSTDLKCDFQIVNIFSLLFHWWPLAGSSQWFSVLMLVGRTVTGLGFL